MGEIWEAPAKINLHLAAGPVDASGYHPIESVVQTIEWCDRIDLDENEEDELVVSGFEVPDDRSNLIWKALDRVDAGRPQLLIRLDKRIPPAAGLGGGSSDAAAALAGTAEVSGWSKGVVRSAAQETGSDVPYFLTGGSATMRGYGERISPLEKPYRGFAVAVAVPGFELSTAEVYRTWDRLGSPAGSDHAPASLPPPLRREGWRNDLTPAAVSAHPEMADWIAEMSDRWETPALMSGSGPAVFACFPSDDEAASAARAAPSDARAAVGVDLRPGGVSRA